MNRSLAHDFVIIVLGVLCGVTTTNVMWWRRMATYAYFPTVLYDQSSDYIIGGAAMTVLLLVFLREHRFEMAAIALIGYWAGKEMAPTTGPMFYADLCENNALWCRGTAACCHVIVPLMAAASWRLYIAVKGNID